MCTGLCKNTLNKKLIKLLICNNKILRMKHITYISLIIKY